MNISTSCAISVTFSPDTSEFTLLTIAPCLATRQKSAYHDKYLRMFWTYLDLLYRFDKRISADDFANIRLAVAQGRCYGNQLNMRDVRKRRVGPIWTRVWLTRGSGWVGSGHEIYRIQWVGSDQVTKFAKTNCVIFELRHIYCRSGSMFVK